MYRNTCIMYTYIDLKESPLGSAPYKRAGARAMSAVAAQRCFGIRARHAASDVSGSIRELGVCELGIADSGFLGIPYTPGNSKPQNKKHARVKASEIQILSLRISQPNLPLWGGGGTVRFRWAAPVGGDGAMAGPGWGGALEGPGCCGTRDFFSLGTGTSVKSYGAVGGGCMAACMDVCMQAGGRAGIHYLRTQKTRA